MVYPSLLLLMRTPRLPVVHWTEAPADLNGLVRFAERRNQVSARVPSHFNWPLQLLLGKRFATPLAPLQHSNIKSEIWSFWSRKAIAHVHSIEIELQCVLTAVLLSRSVQRNWARLSLLQLLLSLPVCYYCHLWLLPYIKPCTQG